MFVFIRKHQTWGLIFIGLVIISFVVFFSPYAKLQGRGGGGRGDYGSIDGKAISSDEYFQALKEAKLEYLLRYRTWPEEDSANRQLGFDSVKQAMNRLFLLKELKDHDIEASDRAVANQIADYFQDRNNVSPRASFAFAATRRIDARNLPRARISTSESGRTIAAPT